MNDTNAVTTANRSRAVAARPTGLKAMLSDEACKARLRDVLGNRAGQFAAALVQTVNKSYMLQKCKPDSVIGAAITAAALNLSTDPNLGEAHLVPYGDECQFQIGYKGLTQLAMRSGQYKRLGWKVVYEGELDSWDELSGDLVINSNNKTSETVIGYAAKFTLVNGFERGSFWTKKEVEEHASRYSQAFRKKKENSPWFTDFDKMALKTVLKELLNTWGPKSIEMETALQKDQAVFSSVDSEGYTDNPSVTVDAQVSAPKPLLPRKDKLVDATVVKEPEPDPENEKSPNDLIAERMVAAGVSFDSFRDVIALKGIIKSTDKDSIPDYTALPAITAEKILGNESLLREIAIKFGKTPASEPVNA